MSILEQAQAIQEEIVANRRTIHKNPELGLDLPKTVAFVKEKLIEMGYTPIDCGKGGVVATIGKPGKTFLLRGDMDALPMKECTDLEFKSTNDWMHSCGHDTHTAMLLGAAKLLKENEDKLNEIFDTDKGSRYVGEFSFGLNPKLLQFKLEVIIIITLLK